MVMEILENGEGLNGGINVGVNVSEFPQFSPGNDYFTWHFQWRGERPQPVHFPISVPFYDALGKLGGSCPPLPSVGGLPFISSTILLAAVGFMTLGF